jgi:hypothetical protein
MMAGSKQYTGMARQRMDCLEQSLKSKGVTPQGSPDSAIIEYQGVKLSVRYDESNQLLKLDILEKPAYIPEALIWGFIDASVQQCP